MFARVRTTVKVIRQIETHSHKGARRNEEKNGVYTRKFAHMSSTSAGCLNINANETQKIALETAVCYEANDTTWNRLHTIISVHTARTVTFKRVTLLHVSHRLCVEMRSKRKCSSNCSCLFMWFKLRFWEKLSEKQRESERLSLYTNGDARCFSMCRFSLMQCEQLCLCNICALLKLAEALGLKWC